MLLYPSPCSSECDAPLDTRLEILLGIARGLEYLHSNDIVHCDMKPESILLGDKWQVRWRLVEGKWQVRWRLVEGKWQVRLCFK